MRGCRQCPYARMDPYVDALRCLKQGGALATSEMLEARGGAPPLWCPLRQQEFDLEGVAVLGED